MSAVVDCDDIVSVRPKVRQVGQSSESPSWRGGVVVKGVGDRCGTGAGFRKMEEFEYKYCGFQTRQSNDFFAMHSREVGHGQAKNFSAVEADMVVGARSNRNQPSKSWNPVSTKSIDLSDIENVVRSAKLVDIEAEIRKKLAVIAPVSCKPVAGNPSPPQAVTREVLFDCPRHESQQTAKNSNNINIPDKLAWDKKKQEILRLEKELRMQKRRLDDHEKELRRLKEDLERKVTKVSLVEEENSKVGKRRDKEVVMEEGASRESEEGGKREVSCVKREKFDMEVPKEERRVRRAVKEVDVGEVERELSVEKTKDEIERLELEQEERRFFMLRKKELDQMNELEEKALKVKSLIRLKENTPLLKRRTKISKIIANWDRKSLYEIELLYKEVEEVSGFKAGFETTLM